MNNKALVIFSGGQDSTTCLGWALNKFKEVGAISFVYGQKHKKEIEQSKIIIKEMEKKFNTTIEHKIIDISFFGQMVDSALTHNGDVNQNHNRLKNLPASFVPNRNAMFIVLSHAYAQTKGIDNLVTGVCQIDFSGYPDCRDDFIKALQSTLNLGYQTNIVIHTPLMFIDKADTFKLAEDNNVLDIVLNYSLTCYNGDVSKKNEWGFGCGECPSCNLRKKGYEEYLKRYKYES